MFRRKKSVDKIDVDSLNDILFIGKKIIRLSYIMVLIVLVLLATYLVKEWQALHFVGEFLAVISPIFIGLIIAWLLDPFVKFLQGKKLPRIVACIIVYILFIAVLFLIVGLLIPAMGSQIRDFIGNVPDLVEAFKDFSNNLVGDLNHAFNYDFSGVKSHLYHTVETFAVKMTTKVPNIANCVVS